MIFDTWSAFELFIGALATFDTIMMMFFFLYLKRMAFFNRDLHAILLERQQEERVRSHIRMAIQSPIRVWREIEPPKQEIPDIALSPKKKIKKTEEPVAEPEEPKKIAPKTIEPCDPLGHKWVMDKEKQYYCEKCGQRFVK